MDEVENWKLTFVNLKTCLCDVIGTIVMSEKLHKTPSYVLEAVSPCTGPFEPHQWHTKLLNTSKTSILELNFGAKIGGLAVFYSVVCKATRTVLYTAILPLIHTKVSCVTFPTSQWCQRRLTSKSSKLEISQ